MSDAERSPGHAASCQKFPSRQAQILLPCLASLGLSTGASLTNTPPVRARRGGATAHMGEKPCVMPPLPVVGKWPLREAGRCGQLARDRSPTACLPHSALRAGGQPGERPLRVTAGRPASDGGTPGCEKPQLARARAPHISCIQWQQAAQHPVPVLAWLCQIPLPGTSAAPWASCAPAQVSPGDPPSSCCGCCCCHLMEPLLLPG